MHPIDSQPRGVSGPGHTAAVIDLSLALSTTLFLMFLGLLSIFLFWSCHEACGILVPRLGFEPGPSAVKAPSPNH